MKELQDVRAVSQTTITQIVSPSASNPAAAAASSNQRPVPASNAAKKGKKNPRDVYRDIYIEFIHKLAQVILLPILNKQSPPHNCFSENGWFNLVTQERNGDRKIIKKSIEDCEVIQKNTLEAPLILEQISHITHPNLLIGFNILYNNKLIEKWILEIDTSTFIHYCEQNSNQLSNFYKQLIIILRSIYSFLLLLPRKDLLRSISPQNALFECRISSEPNRSRHVFETKPKEKEFHFPRPTEFRLKSVPIFFSVHYTALENIKVIENNQPPIRLMGSHIILDDYCDSPEPHVQSRPNLPNKHRPAAINTTNLPAAPTPPPTPPRLPKGKSSSQQTLGAASNASVAKSATQTPPPVSRKVVVAALAAPLSGRSLTPGPDRINRSQASLKSQNSQSSPRSVALGSQRGSRPPSIAPVPSSLIEEDADLNLFRGPLQTAEDAQAFMKSLDEISQGLSFVRNPHKVSLQGTLESMEENIAWLKKTEAEWDKAKLLSPVPAPHTILAPQPLVFSPALQRIPTSSATDPAAAPAVTPLKHSNIDLEEGADSFSEDSFSSDEGAAPSTGDIGADNTGNVNHNGQAERVQRFGHQIISSDNPPNPTAGYTL